MNKILLNSIILQWRILLYRCFSKHENQQFYHEDPVMHQISNYGANIESENAHLIILIIK